MFTPHPYIALKGATLTQHPHSTYACPYRHVASFAKYLALALTQDKNAGINGLGGAGAGNGGWDTSSDEGGGGRGATMRDFEKGSAENTRRALLENDAQLCQQQQEQQQSECPGDGFDNKDGRKEPPSRFVPGDPFANEEADVEAWARHFTYLSVVPSNSLQSVAPATADEKATGSIFGQTTAAAATVTTAPQSRAGETPALFVASSVRKPEGDSVLAPPAAAAATPRERAEEDQGEVILASHGVYEEYLAYDCRPPEEGNNAGVGLGEGGLGLGTDGASPLTPHDQACEVGDEVQRPHTPQRELRQEIMDRLFDELWLRLTPDLLLLAANARGVGPSRAGRQEAHGNAIDPSSSVGGGEFYGTAPRDSMDEQ